MSSVARPFRLATRGSPLARWQADRVVVLLAAVGVAAEPMIVDTEGDRRTDVPLTQIGGQGVFVKEVQAAVARGDADAAVHSAKDLPASEALSIPGMVIGAFPERGDPRDVLVGGRLEELPTGALVATGSARRRVQLANLRPDLTFTDLRGNLATRLAKVGADGVIAVVAARAALDRLDWEPPPGMAVETLEPEVMLPQVAQGALAVECRAEDDVTRTILAAIDDDSVRYLVEAERAFLSELGGGCTLPVGAHAVPVSAVDANGGNSRIRLTGMVAGADGLVVLRHEMVGTDGLALGRAVARYLIDDAGGKELMSWSPAP